MLLLGIALIVIGVGLMLYKGCYYGLPAVLAGIVALPFFWNWIFVRNEKPISRWWQVGIVFVIFMIQLIFDEVFVYANLASKLQQLL